MKNYLADPNFAYGYAKTEDYKAIMETASGENLTEFFNDWIYNQGYPSFTVEWSIPSSSMIRLTLSQAQSHASVSFFEAPVRVRIHGTGGEMQDEILDHTVNGEIFDRSVLFDVASVEFDPEADLISKNNTVSLNINDISFHADIKLVPNPALNVVNIQKPDDLVIYKATIYNMLGQRLGDFSNQNTLNVSNLSSGLHFLKLETNFGTFHKSLLKQ